MSAAENLQTPSVDAERADDQTGLRRSACDRGSSFHHAYDRIREAVAILNAISVGELLSALPQSPTEQNRHETAVSLLSAMEVLLREALGALQD